METTDRAAPKRLAYAPGLDGLRALACLAVILYHGHLFGLVNGQLGVPIFFTLSGYLITSLLVGELRASGRIDLRSFWRRRVFRIIPMLWVVTGVTAAAAIIAWAPSDPLRANTLAGAGASVLFIANWLLVPQGAGGAGFLDSNWSVAVEEQFYLVWPLLLLLAFRLIRSERLIASVAAGVAVAVASYRFVIAPSAPTGEVWFATSMQLDALLIGCAVALGFKNRSRVVGAVASALLICLLWIPSPDVFLAQIGKPAVALCTALILPLLQERPGMLGWRPLVAIGQRSYGLYLWGGPIVNLANYIGASGLGMMIIGVGGTFVVAELTYRWVEVPMRHRGRRRPDPMTQEIRICPTLHPLVVGQGVDDTLLTTPNVPSPLSRQR